MLSERISIDSIATIGKGLTVKREKGDNDTEIVNAHLRFSGLFVDREVIDELVGRSIGWAQACLFDDQGVPIAHMQIALPKLELSVTGTVRGSAAATEALKLMQAELTGVVISLTNLGGLVAGQLSWEAAGDEVSDAEPLLGQECAVKWTLTYGGQRDLLRAAA